MNAAAEKGSGSSGSTSEDASGPRLSRLFTSVLGSPFLTYADSSGELESVPPLTLDYERCPSPTPTADYSIISRFDQDGSWLGSPMRRPWSMYGQPPAMPSSSPLPSLKSLLPKIWDVLASPGKSILAASPSTPSALRIDSSAKYKGKEKALYSDDSCYISDGGPDYSMLSPLDGDEGELIDDEGCFIDVRAVTGIDILGLLPPELSLHVLSFLFPDIRPSASHCITNDVSDSFTRTQSCFEASDESMHALVSCLAVSQKWRKMARDNSIWKAAFTSRWPIDLRRRSFGMSSISNGSVFHSVSSQIGLYDYSKTVESPKRRNRMSSLPLSMSRSSSLRRRSSLLGDRHSQTYTPQFMPLSLDWYSLYQQRLELEKRWRDRSYEPNVTRIDGHTDSVYCLEVDEASSLIITGSRDRSIKFWRLNDGQCIGTLSGAHSGSVLCLKFERASMEEGAFVISGSSDCTICIWDIFSSPARPDDCLESDSAILSSCSRIDGAVRSTLVGHRMGVLDIRVDQKWIVSCSKDGMIKVWDRPSLTCVRTMCGHEGPVNAVGLQAATSRIVSASGDGTMIMWDIQTGEKLRTFEGHARGLACIDIKDDVIVSGSNDHKIKVWSASRGECIRTLVGHDNLVRALSFDAATGLLVSASYDRSIKVWDLKTGKMLREFRGSHSSHIFDVKFSSKYIVSTSHDQKVVVQDFSAGLPGAVFF